MGDNPPGPLDPLSDYSSAGFDVTSIQPVETNRFEIRAFLQGKAA
jgi:hypothetical protein